MSNLEDNLQELKQLVKGCCQSIKDIQLDNREIRGQLSYVRNLVDKDNVSDNRGYCYMPDLETHTINQTDSTSSDNSKTDGHGASSKPPVSSVKDEPNYLPHLHWPPCHPSPKPSYYTPVGFDSTPSQGAGYHLSTGPTYVQHSAPASHFRDSAPRSHELQAAYKAVHDRWKNHKLDPDLMFNDSKANLDKKDIPVHNVLAVSAHILETGFKIINENYSEESGLPPEAANELYVTMCHHMRTLQDKQTVLVVNKNYDADFAKQYQSIMSGTTNMRQENIQAINQTQAILQYRVPAKPQRPQQQQNFNNQRKFNKQKATKQKNDFQSDTSTKGEEQ